ncbi:MAG: GyrI-like domain-containing protein [Salinivirgaceae bacterium]|nr:GyrI-like domain-containing protein [Salinivirgaceae bacterium]
MKALKRILLVFLALIIVVLIIGMFLPKHVHMQRDATIHAPMEMVYDQVDNLHNWEVWSPWHRMDANMAITYENEGVGQGAAYSWVSEKMGNGKLIIAYSHPFDTIKTDLDFGHQGIANADYYFQETPDGIHLTWTFDSDMGPGPIGRWMGLLMKPMLGKSYDDGLRNLDSVCTGLQKTDWFYVKTKIKDSYAYISLTQEVTYPSMSKAMEYMYGTLMKSIEKNGLKVTDAPIAIYHTWGDTIKVECGLIIEPTDKEIEGVDKKEMPQQKYAVIKYTGPYEGLEKVHMYMDKYLKSYQLEVVGGPIEKYKTDPVTEPDPMKWVTYVMYPIK